MANLQPSSSSTPLCSTSSVSIYSKGNRQKSSSDVEESALDEFKLVFSEYDVTFFSEIDNDVDESSVANTSSQINVSASVSEEAAASSECSRPYVPYSIEELSIVKSIHCWSNCNVRVIGKMSQNKFSNDLWALESIGEEGGPFSILVDLKLLRTVPPKDTQLQMFGELKLTCNFHTKIPFLLAKFFRDVSCVDLFYYNEGLEELKKYVPLFIDKRKLKQSQQRNDSDAADA